MAITSEDATPPPPPPPPLSPSPSHGTTSPKGEEAVIRKSITRPSVQALQTAKKVGFMRGLFEGLTTKKNKSELVSSSPFSIESFY
jgi:hypothetical protein